jgi:hypothetical protein
MVNAMKTEKQLFDDARICVVTADLVLGNEKPDTLSSSDVYDLAEKLERASRLLLVVGDRKMQTEINKGIIHA